MPIGHQSFRRQVGAGTGGRRMAWSMQGRNHHKEVEPSRWDRPPTTVPGQRAEIHAPRAAELLDHPTDQPSGD